MAQGMHTNFAAIKRLSNIRQDGVRGVLLRREKSPPTLWDEDEEGEEDDEDEEEVKRLV